MSMGSDPLPREPLRAVGTWTALATALIALLVAFGLPVSDAQQAAILGLIAVAAPIVVALVGRGRVYAPETVRRMVHAAERRPRV